MHRVFSNRRIITLAIILIVSNLIIAGVSLYITYTSSTKSLETSLIDMVERQKTLVTVLHEQGKNEAEIIRLIKSMREKHYSIGEAGEFVIANKEDDSINFLLALGNKSNFKLSTNQQYGLPMQLALKGKSGFVKGTDYKGELVLAAYTFVPELSWGIVAKIPATEVNHPYYVAIFLVLMVSLALILISILIFVKVTDPLLQTLKDSEAYYRSLFENRNICMLIVNPANGKIVDTNPAACKFYGYEHSTMVTMNISQINTLPPEEIKQKMEAAQAEKESHFVFKHKLADGSIRDVEVSSGSICLHSEPLLYSIIFDVTDRKKAEQKIRDTQILLQSSIESTKSVIILSIDKNYNYLFFNAFHHETMLFSYGKDVQIGMNLLDCITDENDKAKAKINYGRALAGESHLTIEEYGEQDRFYYETRYNPIYNDNNEIIGATAFSTNVTDRMIAANVLKESEERYKRITEGITDYLYTVKVENGNAIETIHSEASLAVTGYSAKELSTNPYLWINMVLPEDQKWVADRFSKILKGEDLPPFEHRIICKDGSIRWISDTAIPKYDSNGVLVSYDGIIKDITERKQAEEALKTSERLLKESQVIAGLGSYVLDLASGMWSSSAVLDTIFGIDETYFRSIEKWVAITHPDWQETMNRYFAEEVLGKKLNFNKEYKIVRVNDRVERWVHGLGELEFNEKGEIVRMLGTIMDITERKLAEEALTKTKILLEQSFEQSPIPMVLVSMPDAIIRIANPACIEFLGFADEPSPVNLSLMELKPSWQDLDLNGNPGKMEELPLARSLMGIKTEGEERTIIRKDGSTRYEIACGFPIFDSKGEIIAGHLIMMDITERKQAEIQLRDKSDEIEAQNEEYSQLNEELYQTNEELYLAKEHAEESDRLKTAFLQNMSHEIRTPMNAIMGFSELLVKNYDNKAKIEKFSGIINQRCSDLLDIITDILDISKIESGQLQVNIEKCNLNSLFDELSLLFSEQQKRLSKQHINFSLQTQCDASDVFLATDKVKLKQIFINLLSNAFKFTENGKIEGGCKLDNNKNLIFYVSDTGMGIPQDKQKEVFERFTQLNPGVNKLVSGTGLGLSIVKGLVNLLGGEIFLESEPGKGSTFSFTIAYKKSQSPLQESFKIEKYNDFNFPNKTILIVEDDLYNVEYLKEILTDTGLHIQYTEFGKDAVEIALNQPIDMVLMDIRLPDIDGYEAIRQILTQKPNMKIITQTAYASIDEKQKSIDAGCRDYISKPTKRELLLAMIGKLLKE